MARRDRIPARVQITGDKNQRELDRALRKARAKIHKVNDSLRAMRRIALGATVALVGFAGKTLQLAAKQQKAEAAMAGALRVQGRLNKANLALHKKIAAELQKSTTFGDEDLLGAQTLLVRLGRVSDEMMPRILALTADLATTLGTDVKNSALLVGRLMADPVTNMSLLSRYGVTINENLKTQIRNLAEAGKKQEASLKLIRAIEEVSGGAAAAIADTDIGAWEQLKNLVGDIGEELGKRLLKDLRSVHDVVKKWISAFNGAEDAAGSLYETLRRGLIAAFSVVVATTVLGVINSIRLALMALGAQAVVTGVLLKGMWGAATFGLSYLVFAVIENWSDIVEAVADGAKHVGGVFEDLWDNLKYTLKITWDNLKRDAHRVGAGIVNGVIFVIEAVVNAAIATANGAVRGVLDTLSPLDFALKKIGVNIEKIKESLKIDPVEIKRVKGPDELVGPQMTGPQQYGMLRKARAGKIGRGPWDETVDGIDPNVGENIAASMAGGGGGGGGGDAAAEGPYEGPKGRLRGFHAELYTGDPLEHIGGRADDHEEKRTERLDAEREERELRREEEAAEEEERQQRQLDAIEARKEPELSYWEWAKSLADGSYKKLDGLAKKNFEKDQKLWKARTKLVQTHFADFGAALDAAGIKSKAVQKGIALGQILIGIARIPADYANFLSSFSYLGPAAPAAAAAMTGLQLAGLVRAQAEVSGMETGGIVGGPAYGGPDNVLTALTKGELVAPERNFDEVVNAVAASRIAEGEGGGEEGGGDGDIRITLELDSLPVFDEVVRRATAERVIR